MAEYRICRLDQHGKAMEPAEIIDCGDDRSAVMKARETAGSNGCELWQDDRLIATMAGRRRL